MTDSQMLPEGKKTMPKEELCKIDKLKKDNFCILSEDGSPARYRLQTKTDNTDQSEPYRKMTVGERDKTKPHKTILMVGETGAGRTTLINVMINYMLGVQREDKVWFEITDDQSDQTSVYSQTSIITVYGFYPQESKTDLTIIDTPGYGDTRGVDLDEQIAASFSSSESAEGINEIDAVCLVIKATQNRLSDRQTYIFDAVQSLFGRDIAENVFILFTHSDGMPPKDALAAVKEAKIKCAVNDKNQPVFFLFNNRQSEPADEEYEMIQELSWNLSFRGMEGLFKFLDTIKPKSVKMTQDVLKRRKQLEAKICNLLLRVQLTELKQTELKQTQEALEKNKEIVNENKNFEYEVDVPYKESVCEVVKEMICCSICEENCYYSGWDKDLFSSNEPCTICTKKCKYSKHIKKAQYVINTKKEKRTYEELRNKTISESVSLGMKLIEEGQELEIEEIVLVFKAFYKLQALNEIALTTDSDPPLHVDFLIEKLRTKLTEMVKYLENIKTAGEQEENKTELCDT